MRATVDFGTGTTDPSRNANQGGVNALLKVDGYGCPNSGQNPKGCNMTYQTSGPNAGYFTTTVDYPVMPADGLAHPIDLNWGTGSGNARISGTFAGVQRSYAAGAGSDPVEYISVSEWESQKAIDDYLKSQEYEQIKQHTRGMTGTAATVKSYELIGG